MNTRGILVLGILALMVGGVSLTYGAQQYVYTHQSTGHVVILAGPAPPGNITTVASFDFPEITAGNTSTLTVTVSSTVAHPLTVTAAGGGDTPNGGHIVVTSDSVIIPAGGSAEIHLTLNADANVPVAGYAFPVTFMAHTG
jgi:hypothetical protein